MNTCEKGLKKWKRHVLAAAFILFMAGCSLMELQPDGSYAPNPDTVATVDAIADVAEPAAGVLTALGLWNPLLAGAGGVLAGAVGAWRNLRPKLQTVQDDAELATAAGEATAEAIEQFKGQYPDQWKALEEVLSKYHGPSVENFYRALRGLRPKQ